MAGDGLIIPDLGQVVLDRAVNLGHISYLYAFTITSRFANDTRFMPHNFSNLFSYFYSSEPVGDIGSLLDVQGDVSEENKKKIWDKYSHVQSIIGYCTGTEPITSCCGVHELFVTESPFNPYPDETWVCYPKLTYKPWPCKHETIRESLDDATAEVSFAATPMWMDLLLGSMSVDIDVQICRFRWETHDAYMLYKGRMESCSLNSGVFNLKFSATWNSGNADVPLYFTQRHCNHAPFSAICGLDVEKFIVKVKPNDWFIHERQNIILSESIALDPEYWKECIVLYLAKYTDIVEQADGSTKEVNYAFAGDNIATYANGRSISLKNTISCYVDPTTTPLLLIPNCCLNLQRCRDIFGNLRRATAWPDMPLKNYAALDVATTGKGTGFPQGHPPADT